MSVNVFSKEVLIGTLFLHLLLKTRDRHFTGSSKPREGLAVCRAMEAPSFLSYFKTLSIGPTPGIEPATSRSAVTALPTKLIKIEGTK